MTKRVELRFIQGAVSPAVVLEEEDCTVVVVDASLTARERKAAVNDALRAHRRGRPAFLPLPIIAAVETVRRAAHEQPRLAAATVSTASAAIVGAAALGVVALIGSFDPPPLAIAPTSSATVEATSFEPLASQRSSPSSSSTVTVPPPERPRAISAPPSSTPSMVRVRTNPEREQDSSQPRLPLPPTPAARPSSMPSPTVSRPRPTADAYMSQSPRSEPPSSVEPESRPTAQPSPTSTAEPEVLPVAAACDGPAHVDLDPLLDVCLAG